MLQKQNDEYTNYKWHLTYIMCNCNTLHTLSYIQVSRLCKFFSGRKGSTRARGSVSQVLIGTTWHSCGQFYFSDKGRHFVPLPPTHVQACICTYNEMTLMQSLYSKTIQPDSVLCSIECYHNVPSHYLYILTSSLAPLLKWTLSVDARLATTTTFSVF